MSLSDKNENEFNEAGNDGNNNSDKMSISSSEQAQNENSNINSPENQNPNEPIVNQVINNKLNHNENPNILTFGNTDENLTETESIQMNSEETNFYTLQVLNVPLNNFVNTDEQDFNFLDEIIGNENANEEDIIGPDFQFPNFN